MKNITQLYKKDFTDLPEKVLQFGEGNFLRAFADWYIEMANRQGIFCGRVVIAQPTPHGTADRINNQNSFYTLLMRGRQNGEIYEQAQHISSVSRCIDTFNDYNSLIEVAKSDDLEVIISNTTEAGISYVKGERLENSPNVSYPAKLTALLFERFKAGKNGLLILPVELIEKNGYYLKKYVLQYADDWSLPKAFSDYINNECKFCSTLVDRIVTGFPKSDYDFVSQKLGYDDKLLTVSEPFNCWIIEGKKEWSDIFPIHKTGLNVVWCDDMTPYRTRKVRILNGGHTMTVLSAYLMGYDIVRDMLKDDVISAFLKKGLFEQVIPTIDLPSDELETFANSVLERFDNPFIDHRLLDISLNSVSKYKARCLCTLIDYYNKFKKYPTVLCFALASLICFYDGEYDGESFVGTRNGEKYIIKDDKSVTDFFEKAYKNDDVVYSVLSNCEFWGENLTEYNGLYSIVKDYYDKIKSKGMRKAMEGVCNE
ncbi:MAG: tagaturonate reductase [Clostridiales bacterium]|nr:tagaturonate reductase [Clostridiales bacterium]